MPTVMLLRGRSSGAPPNRASRAPAYSPKCAFLAGAAISTQASVAVVSDGWRPGLTALQPVPDNPLGVPRRVDGGAVVRAGYGVVGLDQRRKPPAGGSAASSGIGRRPTQTGYRDRASMALSPPLLP